MNRSGAALLEALIALVVLGTSAVSVIQLVGQSTHTVESILDAEQNHREADRFMRAVSQWSRSELNQRLGVRQQGPWRLDVRRPGSSVFAVALRDSLGEETLFSTMLFRPVPLREPAARDGGEEVP